MTESLQIKASLENWLHAVIGSKNWFQKLVSCNVSRKKQLHTG